MENKLKYLRQQVDINDLEILKTLAKRQELVKKIGKLKKNRQLSPLDQKRWNEVLESRLRCAKKLKLSTKFVKKLYQLIHEYSLEIERNI